MRPKPRMHKWKQGKCYICGYRGKVTAHGKRCKDCFMLKVYRCFFCGWEMEKADATPMVSGQPTAGYLCPECHDRWPDPFTRSLKRKLPDRAKPARASIRDLAAFLDFNPGQSPKESWRARWRFIRTFYLRRKKARELVKGSAA